MKPTELGLPCWEKANLPRAISSVAQVDVAHIDYFLSSHSPIEGIVNDNTGKTYSEESFFQELMNSAHGQVLALVHGDPGTGKSHLIHWLKLRCDDALKRGDLTNVVPVLVQRRSGSLKDTLEQIVQQLPGSFAQYLTRLQEAIGRISESTARLKLAQMLFLELSPGQRATRNRQPLPRELKDLPEVCNSTGFRDWLARVDGVIDRNIKRLDQGSEIEERENEAFPYFTEADFLLPTQFRGKDTPQVRDLADEFEEDEDLRERAATLLNEVLPDALREMTGLSDSGLRDIFDKIRKDLKAQKNELALFIEDVSVMSALDEEVFVAVEPQPRADLCRMVAVLGLTNQGWIRLPDNQKQRVNFPVNVDGKSNQNWVDDSNSVATFTARYLNTVRLSPDHVSELATDRRNGKGLTISACSNCPVRTECHSTFGNVTIDGLEVGTFPFTALAPQRLLTHLDQHATTRRNQRGLLATILHPILDAGHDELESGSFPSTRLAVSLPEPSFWTVFEHEYCGNWSKEEKARAKLFIQGWTKCNTPESAARILKPFLKPLHLPIFSKGVKLHSPDDKKIPPPPEPQPPTPPPTPPGRLTQIIEDLRKWSEGGQLERDADVRNLLAKFFRTSIPWDDEHFPPVEIWKRLIADAGNKIYKIEDMRSNPAAGNFRIEFARSEENRAFFEALAQFEYTGRGSWSFPHAELYKRKVHAWLRENATRVIESLQPSMPITADTPVAVAVQILSLAAIIRRRTRLPVEPQDSNVLVAEVLADFPGNGSLNALSNELKHLISDLTQRHKDLKRLVVSELSSPQGRTGAAIFINPTSIITAARAFCRELKIESLDSSSFGGGLTNRYGALNGASVYGLLGEALEIERRATIEKVEEIAFTLRAFGMDTSDLSAAVVEFCNSIPEIVGLAKKADVVLPFDEINELIRGNVLSQRRDTWGTAVRQASEQASSEALKVLLFDPGRLIEFHSVLVKVTRFLDKLDQEANKILDAFETDGDPDILISSLMGNLNAVGSDKSLEIAREEATA